MTGPRRLAAIMFADMVGYTAASQADESGAIQRVQELDSILRPILGTFGGRKVKSTGDGMLVAFESALQAAQCAVELQRRLYERNSSGATPIRVRLGVHLGDVEEHGEDILGDAVNIAARIEPLSDEGGVCISGEVYAQVQNKMPTVWLPLPPRELKGIKQSVSLYRARLDWMSEGTGPEEPALNRIAVLPFANFSPDVHDEYFADGLTEELITVLAKIQQLRVIARTSVFPYKGTTKPLVQIGRELGVSAILEGSVRKAGDRIRVTAQLIDVGSQEHRWAEAYDRQLEDVFAVQTDVAREVAKALQVRLGNSEESRLAENRPVGTESYLAYLQGRKRMQFSYSEQSLREAQWQFEHAIALDPTNARAYAALSEATHLLGLFHRTASRKQTDAAARELAKKAVELNPDLADGHSALGLILYSDCEWQAAEEEARLAVSLNPSDSTVRLWYSMLLQEEGRADEALREMKAGFASDPQSRMAAGLLANLELWLRRTDEVGPTLERLRELDSAGRYYHNTMAWFHLVQGDVDRAREEAEIARPIPADDGYRGPSVVDVLVRVKSGQMEQARALLDQIQAQGENAGMVASLAMAYGMLGDLDASFRLLDKKAETGLALQIVRLEPFAEPIREDPRFREILNQQRIPM